MSESSYYSQADVDTPGEDDIEFDTADLFEALRVQRRRFVVLLVDRFDEISVGDASDRIAAFENDGPVSASERKAVYVGLYQSHAEKLDESGLVSVDGRVNKFTRTQLTAEAAEYIREAYNRFACFEGAAEVLS